MFWTIFAAIVAFLSLIANIIQLFQNQKLKKQIINPVQKVEGGAKGIQQTHSGQGHNIQFNGNVDTKKS